LIVAIGEFVLRQACLQAAVWRADGLIDESFVTWVNVSGRQLSGGGVDELVDGVLLATGLPPGMLGLEVTETAIVAEGHASERAREELEALHDRGVRIAIDDFGTGVSSLGQLRRFPVDLIKVDKSFVQGVARDQKDAAIATNVVNLAHALGLPAIAEGIETDSQLESMVEFGCDLAQGYLFARPAPAAEVASMLGVLTRAVPVD
jgi:EAL domain-containing protein (putative c-di-GMP-specific phosphodiesterase class I)